MKPTITSLSNNKIKNLIQLQKKSKARRQQSLFVVEGIRMFLELPSHLRESCFVSESFITQCDPETRARITDASYEILPDHLFRQISDTITPQGILALARFTSHTIPEILDTKTPPLLLILENIQDPGNMGTILRTAEGAGVTGVLITQNSVDIYNPKVIRSTMGSIYRLPFLHLPDLPETLTLLKSQGIDIYAAHLDATHNYFDCNYTTPTAFLIGNEGNGLTPEATAQATNTIKIPMSGQVDSLNAAISASLLIYEAKRQRMDG